MMRNLKCYKYFFLIFIIAFSLVFSICKSQAPFFYEPHEQDKNETISDTSSSSTQSFSNTTSECCTTSLSTTSNNSTTSEPVVSSSITTVLSTQTTSPSITTNSSTESSTTTANPSTITTGVSTGTNPTTNPSTSTTTNTTINYKIFDDFETYPAGSCPPDPPWMTDNCLSFIIEADPFATNHGHIVNVIAPSGSHLWQNFSQTVNPDFIYLEFDVYITNVVNIAFEFLFQSDTGDKASYFRFKVIATNIFVQSNEDGTWINYSTATFMPNQWHHIKLVADKINKKSDLYIDSNLVVNGSIWSEGGNFIASEEIKRLTFRSGEVSSYIDNVIVY